VNWWGFFAVLVVYGLIVYIVGYWVGKDSGSDEAWKWRMKFEEQRRKNVLQEQRLNGLEHELEFFYPKPVWRNEKWTPPDEPYGSP
jgi:hypothetical protein